MKQIDPADTSQISGIGGASVDPSAEKVNRQPATVSAQQEKEFYQNSATEFSLQQGQQDLGWLGKFFGSSHHAPTNIAGFVAIASLLILVLSVFTTANAELAEARKWLIGLITSALSFIFGAASKK